MRTGKGYVLIRAVLDPEVDTDRFDAWYDAHLLDTLRLLKPLRGWRYWSPDEAPEIVHYAVYEFDSPEARDLAYASDEIQELIADFTANWGDSVTRVRSRVVVAGEV